MYVWALHPSDSLHVPGVGMCSEGSCRLSGLSKLRNVLEAACMGLAVQGLPDTASTCMGTLRKRLRWLVRYLLSSFRVIIFFLSTMT